MTELAVTEHHETGLPSVSAPSLIGRQRELAALGRDLASPSAVVLVEGEAGIGKTRLVREFLASAAGKSRRVLMARCPPFRQPCTLGPIADALRQAAGEPTVLSLSPLAGGLRPLFPEWAGVLPSALEPLGDAGAERYRLYRALAELLEHLRIQLVVAEDAHWADEATLEFLLFLAARQPHGPSLLATFRPEDIPADSLLRRLSASSTAARVMLGPLDARATRGLVSSMLDDMPVSQVFADFLHERTDGLPLALEETVRLMADRGDLVFREGAWARRHLAHIQVPPTVRDAVLERTGRLGPGALAVLRAASVVNTPADEVMLSAVAGLSSPWAREGLSEALRSGLLEECRLKGQGLAGFHHVLAGQVIYNSIPGPERRSLHQRAGLALEQCSPPPLARLARHFQEAGDLVRWHRYGEQVADLALAAGDDVTAGTMLHALVISGEPGPREVVRFTSKIMLQAFPSGGHLRDLAAALRTAQEAAHLTSAEAAELSFQLGRVLFAMGDEDDQCRAELERALVQLPHGSLEAVRIMSLLGHPTNATCLASEHKRWLRRAADLVGTLEPSEQVRLHVDIATALLQMGEQEGWAEAAQIPASAPGPRERLHVTRGQGNVGECAMVWGRYEEARRVMLHTTELAERYGYPRLRDAAIVNLVHLDWFTGAWEGLAARAAALAANEDLEPRTRLEPLLVEGLLHASAGARVQARERLAGVIDGVRQGGAAFYMMEPAAALARLWLADGDAEDALQVTDWPCQVLADKGVWLWGTELVPARFAALAATGRIAEADELVAVFARGLRGREAPAPRAALADCRAVLAQAREDHTRAAVLFARAAAAWQALPRPYDALLAREQQACAQIASGRSAEALPLLEEVWRGLSGLGATASAARVQKVLRGHGVKPASGRVGRRSYGSRLSPRETEVVRLLVAGRTVRQIAHELFLSPKTIDCHLDSARRKLKAPSRVALAAAAVEAGIVASESKHSNIY